MISSVTIILLGRQLFSISSVTTDKLILVCPSICDITVNTFTLNVYLYLYYLFSLLPSLFFILYSLYSLYLFIFFIVITIIIIYIVNKRYIFYIHNILLLHIINY